MIDIGDEFYEKENKGKNDVYNSNNYGNHFSSKFYTSYIILLRS